MGDDRLRELERAWKESGSQQHELAYLLEQIRTGGSLDWESYSRLAELNLEAAANSLRARVERGDLEQRKLELAAYSSHEPARLALGDGAPAAPETLEEWFRGVGRWGSPVVVRALGLTADRLLSAVRPAATAVEFAAFEAVPVAVGCWADEPCLDRSLEASDAAEAAMSSFVRLRQRSRPEPAPSDPSRREYSLEVAPLSGSQAAAMFLVLVGGAAYAAERGASAFGTHLERLLGSMRALPIDDVQARAALTKWAIAAR